jgi:hypothetical protein
MDVKKTVLAGLLIVATATATTAIADAMERRPREYKTAILCSHPLREKGFEPRNLRLVSFQPGARTWAVYRCK